MRMAAYGAVALLLALGSCAAIWGAMNGIWQRQWKFALGAALFALLFAGGANSAYECGKGHCVKEDPSVPRLR